MRRFAAFLDASYPSILRKMEPFKCGICSKRYNETESRIPRTLTACGHTICELCAREKMKDSKLVCPIDQIPSNVPNDDIEELKKNFAILEAIQKLDKKTNEEAKKHPIERSLRIPCDEDPTHLSVFYCTKCKANFCERCSISLHSSNFFSSHKIIKITEKPEARKYCQIHPSNEIRFYCLATYCKAEKKLMCWECPSTKSHEGHKFQQIDSVFEQEKERLTVLLSTTNEKIKNVHSYIDEIEQLADCPENDQQFIEVKKNIIEMHKKYSTSLLNWKASNLELLEKQVHNRLDTNTRQKFGYDQQLGQLEALRKACLNAMKLGKFDYLQNFEEFQSLKTLLSSMYVFPPTMRIKLTSPVDPPRIGEFAEIYKSTKKIMFLCTDFYELNQLQDILKEMSAVEDKFLKLLRWKDHQGNLHFISVRCDEEFIKSDHSNLENITYVLKYTPEKIGKLSQTSTIIYHCKKGQTVVFDRIAEEFSRPPIFPKLSQPVFCVKDSDDNDVLIENVLWGNYQDNPYFDRLLTCS